MTSKFHEIWIEQCTAAENIRERWGTEKAIGYLIGEKLLSFTRVADEDPEFAAELPKFVGEVRRIFEPHEIQVYLDTVRRLEAHGHVLDNEEFEVARDSGMFEEDVVRAAEDVIRMGRIREMLLG